MTTVLHLGAGKLMVATINLLKKSGYRVLAIDANPKSPGFSAAHKFAVIDIKNENEIEAFCKENNVDCILAVNDAGVNAAAEVCKRLGLNYITPEVALRATDKGLMRQAWQQANCPQPAFIIAHGEDEINNAVTKIGYPVVVKPCLNWGSKGVSIINNSDEKDFSINYALKNNRNDRFIVEKKIEGTELTVEGLVLNNSVSILAVSDKVHQPHPQFCVAMQLNYPANISIELYNKLAEIIDKSVKALGLNNCAFHCECIYNTDGIFLVEMAARPGGGHIFGHIVEAVSGIPMPIALVEILCGKQPDIKPKYNHGATYRFFAPPAGIFNRIENLTEAGKIEGVLDLGFDMQPGTVVNAIAGDADRPGYMVTKSSDRNSSIALSDKVLHTLQFIMD